MRKKDVGPVVAEIADTLGETEAAPFRTIRRIVQELGEPKARELLEQVLEIEARGGILTEKGDRRRTPGGVFLKLAKEAATPEQRQSIFFGSWSKKKSAQPPPTPEEVARLIQESLKQKGTATTVKITLIGRPGRVVKKGDVVLTTMQTGTPPSLPKGLPEPPPSDEPATFVIFIAAKQWGRVEAALQNDPEDALIVEGYPVFNPSLKAMAVWIQSTTTRALQRAKRKEDARK